MIVVDASVAVKWFLVEEGTPEANAWLRSNQKLFAPDLLRVEVFAGITRRFRTKELPEAAVRQHCQDWSDMVSQGHITFTPSERDLPQALDLALQLAHPLQDCLYLALALRLEASLVTADSKFVARTAGAFPQVQPLWA